MALESNMEVIEEIPPPYTITSEELVVRSGNNALTLAGTTSQVNPPTTNNATSPAWAAAAITPLTTIANSAIGAVASYFTTKNNVNALTHAIPPNSNTIAVYNEGELVLPTTASLNGQNIVVFNAKTAKMVIAAPQPTTKVACPRCGMQFNNGEAAQRHQRQLPEYCKLHRMCLATWSEHNAVASHRRCGVVGCEKATVDFGSDERYRRHFKNKHGCS